MSQHFYFKQFNLAEADSLVLFDSGTTTSGQSGSGSDGNKRTHIIPQSSCIIGALPSACLGSYPLHSLGRFILLYRDAIGVLDSPSRLGHSALNYDRSKCHQGKRIKRKAPFIGFLIAPKQHSYLYVWYSSTRLSDSFDGRVCLLHLASFY